MTPLLVHDSDLKLFKLGPVSRDISEDKRVIEKNVLPDNVDLLITRNEFPLSLCPIEFRAWPSTTIDYQTWFHRIQRSKGMHWETWGIHEMIKISQEDIPCNPSLIFSLAHFWNTSINGFIFPFGMMTPTIMDVSAILGLPSHGDDVSPNFNSFDDIIGIIFDKHSTLYSTFIKVNSYPHGHVTDSEHNAFLLYWLYNLRKGTTIDKVSGPLWFLNLWTYLYIPEILPPKVIRQPKFNTYGRMFAHHPVIEGVPFDFVSKFFIIPLREAHSYFPYYGREGGHRWVTINPFTPSQVEILTLQEYLPSAVIARDMPNGVKPTSKIMKSSLEPYSPQFFARQFGLVQDVPATIVSLSSPMHRPLLTLIDLKQTGNFIKKKIEEFQLSIFSPTPSETPEFVEWWHKIRSALFSKEVIEYLNKYIDVEKEKHSYKTKKKKTSPPPQSQLKKRKFVKVDDTVATKESVIPLVSIASPSTYTQPATTPATTSTKGVNHSSNKNLPSDTNPIKAWTRQHKKNESAASQVSPQDIHPQHTSGHVVHPELEEEHAEEIHLETTPPNKPIVVKSPTSNIIDEDMEQYFTVLHHLEKISVLFQSNELPNHATLRALQDSFNLNVNSPDKEIADSTKATCAELVMTLFHKKCKLEHDQLLISSSEDKLEKLANLKQQKVALSNQFHKEGVAKKEKALQQQKTSNRIQFLRESIVKMEEELQVLIPKEQALVQDMKSSTEFQRQLYHQAISLDKDICLLVVQQKALETEYNSDKRDIDEENQLRLNPELDADDTPIKVGIEQTISATVSDITFVDVATSIPVDVTPLATVQALVSTTTATVTTTEETTSPTTNM